MKRPGAFLFRALALGASTALLSACVAPGAALAPTRTTTPPARAEPAPPSAESRSLANYYASTQRRLLTQGLLRRDGGGPDTPVSAEMLAANFERIALYDEYSVRNGRFVAEQTPSRLRRWEQPVRLNPVFGASVPADQVARDRRNLSNYASRLARVSGLPISLSGESANYHVLFLNNDEQRDAEPLLRQLVPGIDRATIDSITQMNRFTFCSVYAFSDRVRPNTYIAAIAVIRAEHPDLLRLSCIHEEIAQGLGLANDSPTARPSIFNDDEEFALLTSQDEKLLSMLYDPRLRPGMTPDEARPIVNQLAAEKLGGPG